MSSNKEKDFDILKVVELARYKKYEITVAGFAAIDKIDKIPIPKKWKSRKIAIQALYALSENLVKYKYLTKEEKKKIAEEVQKRTPSHMARAQNLFAPVTAPLSADESEEEELPSEDTSFQADYVDDRYDEDSMMDEGVDESDYDQDSEDYEED